MPLGRVIRQALLRLSRMPLLLAIVLGLALSAAGLQPPGVVSTAIEMLADASVACALFVVGGTLAGTKAAELAGDVVWIMLAKLVLHPLAVAAGFLLVGDVPPALAAVGIVFASAPMITVYPVLGQRFAMGSLSAAALLATTTAGFATMTIVLALVANGGL